MSERNYCHVEIVEGAIYFYDENGNEIMNWNEDEFKEEFHDGCGAVTALTQAMNYLTNAWFGKWDYLKEMSGRYNENGEYRT